MAMFRLYVHQTSRGESVSGYFDEEGNELTNDIDDAGTFTLEEAANILKSADYDECRLTTARLEKAEIDLEIVDTALGKMVRFRHPPDTAQFVRACEELTGALHLRESTIRKLWDESGMDVCIDWINEQIQKYGVE